MTFYNQHSTALVGSGSENNQGYQIQRSLRFRSSASAYLNRTPASAGNQKTWTWSGWVKRAKPGSNGLIFAARTGVSGSYLTLVFSSVDDLRMESNLETSYPLYKTNALFRDPSAWYHIVVALDTTQATSTDRLKIYINGVVQTTASYNVPAQNTDLNVNSTATHLIGQQASGSYFDGYMTEINFIDGQALDPSYFGETDAIIGVWKPKAYGGTYGTNGFYLNFSDNTSTTTLGYDQSSNSNNWTTNNISLTAGSTYDSMTDVPTLTSPNAANYCTWNPIDSTLTRATLTNGNLTATSASGVTAWALSNFYIPSSGQYYAEFTITASTDTSAWVAVRQNNASAYLLYARNGNIQNQSGVVTTVATLTAGDVVGISVNASTGGVIFYKNNTQVYSGTTTVANAQFAAYCAGSTWDANFGQRPFAYTPPSGFNALNTYNLPDSTIKDGSKYFNAVTWTGTNTNAGNSITGVGFSPDFVWAKARSQAYSPLLYDRLRGTGATAELKSDGTEAEGGSTSSERGYLNSFDSDGFSSVIGSAGDNLYFNQTSQTYVAWNWKANGSGVSNSDGSITSTVSANRTAGFSIGTFTYTGPANGTCTVGHGLGIKPDMVIVRDRDYSPSGWFVWHKALGDNTTDYLSLQTGSAEASYSTMWGTIGRTSTLLGFTQGGTLGANNSHVFYAFAGVEGYSAFGSYAGNSSADGPFVYTGFKPRWIMIRSTSAAREWNCWDTARGPYNLNNGGQLNLGNSHAEYTGSLYDAVIDVLSNGFKLRNGSSPNYNQGETYIYAAFAENPFKYSLAR